MNEVSIQEIGLEDDRFQSFYNSWQEEIENIFIGAERIHSEEFLAYILSIDGKDIGIFVYRREDNFMEVLIDFVVPECRDQGIGSEFYRRKASYFRAKRVLYVRTSTNNQVHKDYLHELGFRQSVRKDLFQLIL